MTTPARPRRRASKKTKTETITLRKLLWKVVNEYDTAVRELEEKKEQALNDLIEKFCPLPQEGEVLIADWSWAGRPFKYKGFRHWVGDVILYGHTVKKDGTTSIQRTGESRIDTSLIRIEIPSEDE